MWVADNFDMLVCYFYPLQCNDMQKLKRFGNQISKVIYCLFHSKVDLCKYGILHGEYWSGQIGQHELLPTALMC